MNQPLIPPRPLHLLTRRALLKKSLPGALAIRLFGGSLLVEAIRTGFAATAEVPETEDNIEGPFYKPGAPFRSVLLEHGTRGTPMTLRGQVLDTQGRPLKGALLDFWHANDAGVYDNQEFSLRGRIHTDEFGRYELRTIKPKWYGADGDFRPAHIHVKAGAPGGPVLTTQLYFKGDPYNAIDPWVRPSLILSPESAADGLRAHFDFVLKTL
jgi:protocatechuate 3,4-dioxygenase beta subunit